MTDAGLPHGVVYDDGTGAGVYRQYSGGSNAQSSLMQFFDLVLGVEHHPAGDSKHNFIMVRGGGLNTRPWLHHFSSVSELALTFFSCSFLISQDMREYMPGPHRRFLEHVATVANIRQYVHSHRWDRALCTAYDACLAMLRSLRDKHIQMVSRYIIVKSRESRAHSRSVSPRAAVNLATASSSSSSYSAAAAAAAATSTTAAATTTPTDTQPAAAATTAAAAVAAAKNKQLRGTGGTALIPFLKQARDETGEPAVEAWARRLLGARGPAEVSSAAPALTAGKAGSKATTAAPQQTVEIVGLAGTWTMDDSEGGLCHW
jgi:indoleamine 2,3-dioxygenase